MEDPDTQQNRRIMKQPRNTNGRFERKALHPNLKPGEKPAATVGPVASSSRAERALERGKAKEENEQESAAAKNKKRPGQDELDDQPRKRPRTQDEEPVILQRVLPRPASSFRGGRLFSKPNPLSYALQAWGGPVILDESSSEDERQPVTPEDNLSPPGVVIDINMESHAHPSLIFAPPPPVLPIPALTFKPSPVNFARRRWASASASPSCDGEPGQADSPANTPQIAPEQEGDPKNTNLRNEDERYTSISPLSSGEMDRYKLWSQAKDAYLSDEVRTTTNPTCLHIQPLFSPGII
ncbi:hypothetical protein BD779DRAFT_966142 [Infundibulicybe gibba]|nr:hypothetical protein BD779DRAFT_966142 [Infundibulicybe gibba]